MTTGERAAADREITARKRRAETPPILRREDLIFEQSSYKGLQIAYIIAPHLGIEVRNANLEVHRVLPAAHTEARRGNEALFHVLNGRGYSLIDAKRYDWESHDSFHVRKGAWAQHFNLDDTEPAHLLVGLPSPLLEHISPYAIVAKGDSFSDMPDDYEPEHPFTKERMTVGYVDGQKWMSNLQLAIHNRRTEREEQGRQARVLLKARDAVIERSEHKGDWKVGLIDRHLGFANDMLGMYVHQMPPMAHTETHKHAEVIVYVLSGRGYSIVEGERYDWRAGDCIFVKPGQWHQHFNTDPKEVSQHLALTNQPLRERVYEDAERLEIVAEPDYQGAAYPTTSGSWWE